jgi:hypothetical protein
MSRPGDVTLGGAQDVACVDDRAGLRRCRHRATVPTRPRDLAITSVYRRGIDDAEIVHGVHERPALMVPATQGL